MGRLVPGLKLFLAPPAWRLLAATIRVDAASPTADISAGAIYACLHRDILPALVHVRAARPTLLVSGSADGEILIRALGHRHYAYVRGSTGEDGGRAFVQLRAALRRGGSVGLAVDGPKGPYGQIRDGVLQLARLTGAPIIALSARPGRARVLDTWDRTVVPWPFSRVEMLARGPLHVGSDGSESAEVRRELCRFFGVEEATR